MAVSVKITLTSVGSDQGTLFDLFSDTDKFGSAFETGVSKAALLAGHASALVPDGTIVIRVCPQTAGCDCLDIRPVYTTTTSTTLDMTGIGCEDQVDSGGLNITEYIIPLNSAGGDLVFDFDAYGPPDKLEIIHQGDKKATTGMTVANEGPFDDVYGPSNIPSSLEALETDQFIGTAKGIVPTREATILSELGRTYIAEGQQLVWWRYTNADWVKDEFAILRVVGAGTTSWDVVQRCLQNPTTTTTTTLAPTTTTTTTLAPTTTTTTTLTGLEASKISNYSILFSVTTPCITIDDADVDVVVYIDTQSPGVITAGDFVYNNSSGTDAFAGTGDVYKMAIDIAPTTYYVARVTAKGQILAPVTAC